MFTGELTRDDALQQRLDETKPIAVSSTQGGLRRSVGRADDLCPVRERLVDELVQETGRRKRASWPAARGEHRRIEVSERFLIHGGNE